MKSKKLEDYNDFYSEIHDRLEITSTRYGLLVIIYGIIITQFFESGLLIFIDFELQSLSIIEVLVILGGVSFIYSLFRFWLFIYPKEVAYKGLPTRIYNHAYDIYKKRGKNDNEIKDLLIDVEIDLLEKANKSNFSLYKRKKKNYYHSLMSALVCVILLSPNFLKFQIDQLNKSKEQDPIEVIIMNDENNKLDSEEPVRLDPEMIKESSDTSNTETKENTTTSDSTSND